MRRLLMSGLAFVFVVGCGLASDEDAGETLHLSENEVQRLESIGYLSFGPEIDPEASSGVIVREPACECTGYYLITYPALSRAELVDSRGRVVRSWSGAEEGWERATLLADGDLLVLAREKVNGSSQGREHFRRVLLRLAFEGKSIWKRALPVHHYVQKLPDSRLAVLTSRSRQIPALLDDTAAIDNGLAFVSADGRIIEAERSFYDMLAGRSDLLELEIPDDSEGQLRADFLHANFFHWMPGGDLVERSLLYAASNVLVTFRKQDALVLFDFERGRAIWAWGRGEVVGPHEGRVLDNGNILLFDNRCRTKASKCREGWSRVVELDPVEREIVWQYRADPPQDFYSHSRGTVERLDNGNTLICSSNQGRVFEVTPGGETVWEYRTPHRDAKGRRAVLRAEHYSRAFVERARRRSRGEARVHGDQQSGQLHGSEQDGGS